MAFRTQSRPAPVESDIPVLENHPEFARVATLRRSLLAARDERQRQLDLLAVEGELARPSGGCATGQRAAMLRDHAKRLRAAAPKAAPPAAVSEDDGLPPAITRALMLIGGNALAEEPDRDARLKKLRAEIRILELALGSAEGLLNEIRATQSFEVAQSLQVQNQAILRTVFDAALALSAAVSAERALYARYLSAGYEDRPDVLIRPSLSSANRLGSTDEWDSEINTFRRRLEALGVI
jgi:hypothetical protein